MSAPKAAENDTAGIWYGVTAYTAWGILPIYWKFLSVVPAHEILAHRIVWSFIFVSLLLLATGGWRSLVTALADKKRLLLVFLSGFLISLNWFTYIFAVNSNHVIETSLGYFINPLVVVLIGVTVLKEKLNGWQYAAIMLATVGVLIIALQYGRLPWIALILAFSFALYGLLKKLVPVDSATGLALETFAVMPLAVAYIAGLQLKGAGALGTVPLGTLLLLVGTGAVTAVPLLLFARGVQRSKFSVIGFLQYIAPTLTLFLGIFLFKEPFSPAHMVSFCFIWAALAIFTLSNIGVLKETRSARRGKQEASTGT